MALLSFKKDKKVTKISKLKPEIWELSIRSELSKVKMRKFPLRRNVPDDFSLPNPIVKGIFQESSRMRLSTY